VRVILFCLTILSCWTTGGICDVLAIELTEENVDKQAFGFRVAKARRGERWDFYVEVQPKDGRLSEIRPYLSGSLVVRDHDHVIVICTLEPEEQDSKLLYEFSVAAGYQENSRFSFEDIGPLPGGTIYWIRLSSPLFKIE
jgi:hypothetical protein